MAQDASVRGVNARQQFQDRSGEIKGQAMAQFGQQIGASIAEGRRKKEEKQQSTAAIEYFISKGMPEEEAKWAVKGLGSGPEAIKVIGVFEENRKKREFDQQQAQQKALMDWIETQKKDIQQNIDNQNMFDDNARADKTERRLAKQAKKAERKGTPEDKIENITAIMAKADEVESTNPALANALRESVTDSTGSRLEYIKALQNELNMSKEDAFAYERLTHQSYMDSLMGMNAGTSDEINAIEERYNMRQKSGTVTAVPPPTTNAGITPEMLRAQRNK